MLANPIDLYALIEPMELLQEWTRTSLRMPSGDIETRHEWVLSADAWLRDNCEGEWFAWGSLEDGLITSIFSFEKDAKQFWKAEAEISDMAKKRRRHS